ncbi:sensor histidine kinase [Rufibacter hautae]|uniref:histidine kinase n=1 Tax=Rufibacter hautae TaxID=2595005 RepID=A0A5B6TCX8_9BACT|nr:HAMP domain-containing sensor histidine kinase [Rufibacter hautae]KAA3436963.1 HAMP domain-containing histidine kinase [Rufibacter hautae]
MKFYFFNTPARPHSLLFRAHYLPQNLRKLRLVANLALSVACGILLLPLLFPFLNQTAHVTFFRGLNISLVLASAVALGLEGFLDQEPKYPFWLAQALCLAFGFAFISCCLGITFIAQSNPRNTLTMYLLGLVTVAFLWDFEYYETLVLVTFTALAFTLVLYFSGLNAEQVVLNQCVSFLILLCFLVLSRVMYSYRATHFIQLQEIEEKNRQIQKISQAKSEILGVVAHDLRSPFNNIEMITSLLQKKNLTPEMEQQYLNLILTSCQNSRTTINELLFIAREEQQETIPLEKLDLVALLQDVQAEWETQLQGSRNLLLSHPATPLYANLNKERFHRVLNNLVSNAVKFTPAQGKIRIQVREEKKKLLLEVSDNGIGIPDKIRPLLFDRFSKARRRGLQGEKSTGLGLSICRQLVEQHGGSIDVESQERQGTTFHITLPAAV